MRSYIGRAALELCVDADLGAPILHPDEILLEDTDFENLFDNAMDGLEDDPAQQAAINVEVPALENWFTPFNEHYVVHPYVRTEPSRGSALHDLGERLVGLSADDYDDLDWTAIDHAGPIGGLAAISEIVLLAAAGRAAI